MAYRNYKIIYKNIVLKKNVQYITAYDINEALTIASHPLKAMGYECVNSVYDMRGGRTYMFAQKGMSHNQRSKHRNDYITLVIVNLHYNRKK